MSTPLGSIVIAAHNEAAVIARTLQHLVDEVERGLVDVIVVCNGCTDRTADVARGFPGVRVSELAQASKTAALREGDRLALPGPRIYLDADVELTGRAAVATLRALGHGVVAGRPPHRFDSGRAHWVVRRWYSVRQELPSVSTALWGAGCYAVSEQGRARFAEFPEVLGDDDFIDSLFVPEEVELIATDPVVVRTPLTVADLVRIKTRSYRSQIAACSVPTRVGISGTQRAQARDLVALVRREPTRVLDVGIYTLVLAVSRLRARVGEGSGWERDTGSRSPD